MPRRNTAFARYNRIVGGAVDKPKRAQGRARKQAGETVEDLAAVLARKVVGQSAATRAIVPYVQMFQAGLAPEGSPCYLPHLQPRADDRFTDGGRGRIVQDHPAPLQM